VSEISLSGALPKWRKPMPEPFARLVRAFLFKDGRMADQNPWHLDRTVSVGHLASTVALIVAASVGWAQVKTDIEGVRQRVISLEETAKTRENNINALRVELRSDIQALRSEVRQDMQLIVREVRSLDRAK